MMLISTVFAALAASMSLVSAHPEEKFDQRAHLEEMTRYHVVAEVNSPALQACSEQPKVKARREQAIARRAATFERLRQERSLTDGKSPTPQLQSRSKLTFITAPFLHRRNMAEFRKWNAVDHNKTGLVSYDASTPAEEIFGANASCILAPDNANGPYFVSQELSKKPPCPFTYHRIHMPYWTMLPCVSTSVVMLQLTSWLTHMRCHIPYNYFPMEPIP